MEKKNRFEGVRCEGAQDKHGGSSVSGSGRCRFCILVIDDADKSLENGSIWRGQDNAAASISLRN